MPKTSYDFIHDQEEIRAPSTETRESTPTPIALASSKWREGDPSESVALEPAAVLPEQLEQDRGASLRGTRALMFAVLEEAIVCLRRGSSHPRAQTRFDAIQAIRWVQSRDDKWIFSFENVCLALDLDAQRLRRQLVELAPKEGQVGEPSRHRLSHRVERPRRPLRLKKPKRRQP